MAKLRFNAAKVMDLMSKSDVNEPLQLVGDQGVYLMSFKSKEKVIVYAEGCDPVKNEDTWWDTKRAIFGGDDGCDAIGTPSELLHIVINCKRNLVVELTPTSLKVSNG